MVGIWEELISTSSIHLIDQHACHLRPIRNNLFKLLNLNNFGYAQLSEKTKSADSAYIIHDGSTNLEFGKDDK